MKEIKKIASGAFARNLRLAKLAYGSGVKLWSASKEEGLKSILDSVVGGQAHKLVNELGLMKGSVMKVGQMLSLYSEAFLSKELQAVLRQLENQSFYLSWEEIQKNLPSEFLEKLDFESKPIAAASLGQVHKAKIKATGEVVAVKIQYRGVRKAIDSDINTLRLFLNILDLLPKDQDFSNIFEEVKMMLLQETDYLHEAKYQKAFRNKVEQVSENIYVPRVYDEFTNEQVFTSEFIDGINPRDWVDTSPSQELVDQLGKDYFEIFFKEIFSWSMVQSDPHPGNYLIQKLPDGKTRWVLLDFGATKEVSEKLQDTYKAFIKSAIYQDRDLFVQTLESAGFVQSISEDTYPLLWDYLACLGEPFQSGQYDWKTSDSADRILKILPKMIRKLSSKKPPGETVFIDRKIGGLYFMLKLIGANFDPTAISKKYC
tara:strand:- start:1816 stop:3102 length:1287 start_codon:yes stop_codon:yes gene_type:complete